MSSERACGWVRTKDKVNFKFLVFLSCADKMIGPFIRISSIIFLLLSVPHNKKNLWHND